MESQARQQRVSSSRDRAKRYVANSATSRELEFMLRSTKDPQVRDLARAELAKRRNLS